MEFQGFKIYPMGDVNLSIVDDRLRVENVSNSGFDGIIIDTEACESYKVTFAEMPQISENAGVIREASLSMNDIGQVITDMEQYTWFNKNSDKVKFGYNSTFLPKHFRLVGKLKDETVFDFSNLEIDEKPTSEDGDVQYCPAVIGVIGVAVAVIALGLEIYNTVKKSKQKVVTKHCDSKGNYTGQSISYISDPEPFEIEVMGKSYTVTEICISVEEALPEDFVGNANTSYTSIGEQITCYNIPYFEIISIEK